ncbi:unnamed protein product [Symbiodinium sp. CCMP2592]|nr:unnamed protein product [Symbiodinium sp. CCMP2592]
MASPRFRLVADPALGVSDLEACLKDFHSACTDSKKSLNFGEYLKLPPGLTWKSAPNAAHLAKLSPLLCKYAAIAPNGVLPSKKHKMALESVHNSIGLQKSEKRSLPDFLDFCDDTIRMALSHCRSLKNDLAKARLFRKADSSQQRAIEDVLSLLTGVSAEAVAEEAVERGSGSQSLALVAEEAVERGSGSQSLALVPQGVSTSSLEVEEVITPGAKKLAESQGLCSELQQFQQVEPAAVFQSVLGKEDWDGSQGACCGVEEVKTPQKQQKPQTAKLADGSPKLFLKGLLSIKNIDGSDNEPVLGLICLCLVAPPSLSPALLGLFIRAAGLICLCRAGNQIMALSLCFGAAGLIIGRDSGVLLLSLLVGIM